MKRIIVRSRKEWLDGPHCDQKDLAGLDVLEDKNMPPRTYRVEDKEDAP